MELDNTDHEIIRLLRKNARMQWREIGEKVHLSGQAVGNRIKRMEEQGVIQAYTLQVDEEKVGTPILAMITVFMKSTNHKGLQNLVQSEPMVAEAYRISGEGCYLLKIMAASQAELNSFLERILQYGNYRVNLSLGKIK